VDFFVENWILILVAFVSGAMLVWPMVRGGGGGGAIGVNEAVRLINREKGTLVDVGEPGEYAASHAMGARNVPFDQLSSGKDLPPNKALPLIVTCPSGARAGRAAALLRSAGYERAVALAGGTNAWRDAGLPVEKGAGEKAEKAEKADKPDKPAKAARTEKLEKAEKPDKAGKTVKG
jgi:rhodanese-related sulfurtransferase